jgi:oligopeptide transport system substrate-binding protein
MRRSLTPVPFLYLCGVRLTHLALVASLVASLAAACNAPAVPLLSRPSPPPPPTLRLALGGTPSTFDPALQRDPWERALASFYTEALLTPRTDLTDVEPAAASAFDVSPDGLTYTFHLRADGRFADGSPVRAADFVASWRRLLDPRVGSPHADLFASIVRGGAFAEALDPEDPAAKIDQGLGQLGLRAPDPLTFQVVLVHPAPWFKWLATLWAGAPQKPGGAGTVCSGPFEIQQATAGVITLVPNPHYRPAPRLRRILAYELGAGEEALQMYRAGRLDLAPVGATALGSISGDRRLRSELRQVPQLTTTWLTFNTFRSPFGSTAVRQAFAAALDRRAYVDGPLGSLGDASFQLLPAGMPDRLGAGGLQSFDAAGARRLLAGSGASTAGLHLLVENTPTGRAFGSFVQQQLRSNLGVSVAIDAVDQKSFADRLVNKQFDLAGPQGWTADYPDPQDWLDLFLTTSGANLGRWQDSLYDQLVGLGDGAADSSERARAYAQAELELAREAPVAFLAQPVAAVLVSPRVRGLTITPYDPAPALGVLRPLALTVTR